MRVRQCFIKWKPAANEADMRRLYNELFRSKSRVDFSPWYGDTMLEPYPHFSTVWHVIYAEPQR